MKQAKYGRSRRWEGSYLCGFAAPALAPLFVCLFCFVYFSLASKTHVSGVKDGRQIVHHHS